MTPVLAFFLGTLVSLFYALDPVVLLAQTSQANNSYRAENGSIIPQVLPANSPNYTQVVNLLNSDEYQWKTVNDAEVLQHDGKLILIVETDKQNRTYNRAYLQTQLNSTSIPKSLPLILSLSYSLHSVTGNATSAIEVRTLTDNSILSTQGLSSNTKTAKFPLPQNATLGPIEFRLYIITDKPGFHVLNVKGLEILEGDTSSQENQSVTTQQRKADDEAWNSYKKSLVFDELGVPYYDYGYVGDLYIGLQRYPITIEHEALRMYDEYQTKSPRNESARQYFLNNADWLVNNTTIRQVNASFPYAIYEHTFTWPHYKLEPPWQSGMAQGRALIVMVKAHELTGEKKYLETAEMLLNSFFVEVKDGGVTSKTDDSGWWYEEYASTDKSAIKDSRVLNGMIFAVQGIHEYYNYTRDPLAKFLFDQGVLALKSDLPKYDKDGYSLYDALGKSSGTEYHNLHVSQLKQLYDLTAEPVFKTFLDRWNKTGSERQ